MRTGVITKKLGMTRILSEDGAHVPVTVLQLEECQVVGLRTKESHGYTAVQVGARAAKLHKTSKPMRGYFAQARVTPKAKLVEFRVSEDALPEVGSTFSAAHFVVGQKVDVTGISIGKGFAGVMKRHNFGGGRASHGASLSHRTHGSTGQCQDPGKVWKGKKMAGQMGNKQATLQNLEVVSVDIDRGLILVRGGVPGPKGADILVSDAIKSPFAGELPIPGVFVNRNAEIAVPETFSAAEGAESNKETELCN